MTQDELRQQYYDMLKDSQIELEKLIHNNPLLGVTDRLLAMNINIMITSECYKLSKEVKQDDDT
jgi:hypothetical protein